MGIKINMKFRGSRLSNLPVLFAVYAVFCLKEPLKTSVSRGSLKLLHEPAGFLNKSISFSAALTLFSFLDQVP